MKGVGILIAALLLVNLVVTVVDALDVAAPIARFNATMLADVVCTTSAEFSDLPGMADRFNLQANRPEQALVLFQAAWRSNVGQGGVIIQVAVDDIVQSDPIPLFGGPTGENPEDWDTHGFNFITRSLSPGMHTATIQWRRSQPGGSLCAKDRSLAVLHK